MNLEGLAEVREYRKDDEAFVCNSWLKTTQKECRMFQDVSNWIFFNNHHDYLMPILSMSTTLVACNPSDSSQILGYITFQDKTLHFVYVKATFRRSGVANLLFEAASLPDSIEYSHKTPHTRYVWRYFDSMTYNPYEFFKYGAIPDRPRSSNTRSKAQAKSAAIFQQSTDGSQV